MPSFVVVLDFFPSIEHYVGVVMHPELTATTKSRRIYECGARHVPGLVSVRHVHVYLIKQAHI